MSLFRSRAKILGQLPCQNIAIPRSASTQSGRAGSRSNLSVAELSSIKNGEIPEREGQKPQITLSRSLFSLFRKKVPNAQDDVTNTCSEEKGQESWISKMLMKPPRPMTPQEKCLMKTREMQKKQEVGLVQMPCQYWKPSVTMVTTENSIPKSNMARCPAPPPTLQPVPPPSVETRLMELHEKHNTCLLHSENEMDMHKYIPKLPYSEFKPKKKEAPEQFCMEKYEDKRSASSDVGDRKKPVSAHSHRRTDRKFSWYVQQSLERPEPAFANMQSKTALIHTGRKNTQHFTHRNYVEPQRPTKIRGHSLQMQVSKRKYILAHTQIKETPKVFPIDNSERKAEQLAHNLILGTKSTTSELPSLGITAKSLTQIPKISIARTNVTEIEHKNVDSKIAMVKKSNMFKTIGEVRQCPQLLKSNVEVTLKGIPSKNESTISNIQKLNTHIKEVQQKHNTIKNSISYNSISVPQCDLPRPVSSATNKNSIFYYQTNQKEDSDTHYVKTSTTLENGQNQTLSYKLEIRRWIKRIKEKERLMGQDKNEMKIFSESEHEQVPSNNKVTHIKNENISKVTSTSNKTHETPNKNNSSKLKALKETQTKLVQPHAKEVSKPSLEVLALLPSSNFNSILPCPKKPLWENVISYTEAKANVDVSLGKKRDYHEHSISQTHNQLINSLGTLQKLFSSQVKQSESLNRFRTQSKPNIKDTIIISDQLRNDMHTRKTELTNVKQELNTNNTENAISENAQENHKKLVIDTENKEHKSVNEADNITHKRNCEHVQQKSTTPSNEVLLERKTQLFSPKNEISMPNIYHQLTHDLQNIQSFQEKSIPSITELVNHHRTIYDSEEKHELPLNNSNCTFGTCSSDLKSKPTEMFNFVYDTLPKTDLLISDVFHSFPENLPEKTNEKSKDLVACLLTDRKEQTNPQITKSNEILFDRSIEENNIDQFGVSDAYTCGRTSENNPPKSESLFANPTDMKDPHTERIRSDNRVQNCSSQIHSLPKLMYETIQAKSCNGLVPIETYNCKLNKNWTIADYAAYFYGAIFDKQDLLNIHLHKLLEDNNNKGRQSSLLENAIINEMKLDQILMPTNTKCNCKQEISKNKLEPIKTEIKDEELANKTSTIYVESSKSTDEANNDTNIKCNSENKDETTNSEEEQTVNKDEHSSENTSNTGKSLSSLKHCTRSIQCCPTKRNYSSWSIREPFNPNQSSYECKSCKKKKDSCKKGKKPKKDRIVPKQMVCTEKVQEEVVKKIHLPGCKLPSASGCSDDRIEALPCIKKEAPAPSFSECLNYPIKTPRFTECDCHKPKYPKCKTGYVTPKNYDACRKKEIRHKPKKVKEEELEDIDEGQQPPCDK